MINNNYSILGPNLPIFISKVYSVRINCKFGGGCQGGYGVDRGGQQNNIDGQEYRFGRQAHKIKL